MTTNLAELKPCPFCGGKAIVFRVPVTDHTDEYDGGYWNASCADWQRTPCAFVNADTRDAAIAAWNKRDPQIVPDPYPSYADAMGHPTEGDGNGCAPLALLVILAVSFAAGMAVGMWM